MLDTVNSFKGYGKVDDADELAFRKKTRRRIIIVFVSAILLIALVIGVVVATLVHNNKEQSYRKSTTHKQSRNESIRAVCSVTQYPESCFSSLSSLLGSSKPDPEKLFNLSMQIAVTELTKLTPLPDQLIAGTNNTRVKSALEICKEVLDDAIGLLNDSISTMEVGPGQKSISMEKIDDMKTWINSAIADQETCLDGLDEMGEKELLGKVKTAMRNATEYTSISLGIVAKIMTLVDNLEIPIHRKLLGLDDQFDFPKWVHAKDRQLLQGNARPAPDITVAQDGTGDYKTIGEALAAVQPKNSTKTVIHVREGKYIEYVVVEKVHWNVMMYGDGMTKTIVSGNSHMPFTPTFKTASFTASGKGFIAMDMGFENTAGAGSNQSVALRSNSDQSVFYRCSFNSYQDTLYAHSQRQFYRECMITGTVDFIFGYAAVVFQHCTIQPRQPMPKQIVTITAQGNTKDMQPWVGGISIHRCVITPLDTISVKTYLGRPWREYSRAIVMESDIAGIVDPAGWVAWAPAVVAPDTVFYAEYKNTGLGSNVDRRVNWTGYHPTVSDEIAEEFSVESLIKGSQWLPQTSVLFDSSL